MGADAEPPTAQAAPSRSPSAVTAPQVGPGRDERPGVGERGDDDDAGERPLERRPQARPAP